MFEPSKIIFLLSRKTVEKTVQVVFLSSCPTYLDLPPSLRGLRTETNQGVQSALKTQGLRFPDTVNQDDL